MNLTKWMEGTKTLSFDLLSFMLSTKNKLNSLNNKMVDLKEIHLDHLAHFHSFWNNILIIRFK